MKAMVLGTARGARVCPITHTVPKPMIPLVRKPVMESVVEHLARHGFDQIVVNTAHLAPAIENYFRDGARHGVQMAYSFEGRMVDGELEGNALGSAGGMRKVQDFSGFFDDTFIVLSGDALIDADLSAITAEHRARRSVATVVVREIEAPAAGHAVVELDGRGEVTALTPVPDGAAQATVATGIYLFEPAVFEHVPPGVEFDIVTELLPALLAAGVRVGGVSAPFQWVEIHSVADYWRATRLILDGEVDGYLMPGREVRAGVHLGINLAIDLDRVDITGPVYIGSGTVVGDGARIAGPSLIGANCVIEPGASVNQCILDDYTRVSPVADLHEKIVFGGQCIDPDGTAIDIAEADIGWLMDDARREAGLDEWQQALVELAGTIPR